tara:strand:+ start:2111 stop:3007 length:897 start_codon:yes stop_codon:yes gene_type:complete
MSEISNTVETTTANAETPVETSTLNTETSSDTTNENIGEVKENAIHKVRKAFGRTNEVRQSEALRQAEFEQMKKPENIALEDLQDIELSEGKGVNYKQVVEALPDDAKTLLGNLRADYTRKTQELAQQRKELEAQMKALTEGEFFQKVKERAGQEDVALDPYDTKSFESRIEQEVARRLQDMFEPVRQQQELQMRQMKLQEFKTAHPDLEDMKTEVADLLKSNTNLTLQDAYYIAKGKKTSSELAQLRDEVAERKAKMREVGLKIGQGTSANPNRPPSGLKGFELYQWFERQKAKKLG